MLTIEFYGVLQQHCDVEQCTVLPVANIESLMALLSDKYPAAKDTLQRTAAAVNEEIVPRHYSLTGNEKIALLPPVGGG